MINDAWNPRQVIWNLLPCGSPLAANMIQESVRRWEDLKEPP